VIQFHRSLTLAAQQEARGAEKPKPTVDPINSAVREAAAKNGFRAYSGAVDTPGPEPSR